MDKVSGHMYDDLTASILLQIFQIRKKYFKKSWTQISNTFGWKGQQKLIRTELQYAATSPQIS